MAATAAELRAPARLLPYQLLVAFFLGLKIWFDLAVAPMGDEAYYWMWGQRPALSYFDHPPLHAWLLGLASLLLGWSPLALRALTWACLAGTALLLRSWAPRMSPADPALWFWRSAAIYLATPVFFLMTTMVFNDYLLIFLCLLAFHFFLLFTDAEESGRSGLRSLYLGAVALGLAGLTKYNAVFLGLGFGAFVLLRPNLRRLLRGPHLYLAALLALAMQAPVLWWNVTQGMASFRFHLGTRLTGDVGHLHFWYPVDFVLNMAGLVLGPFLFIAVIRMLRDRSASPFEGRARALGLTVFGVSTLAMLVLALFVYVYFYWNIVGYVTLVAVAFRYLGTRWLLRLHFGFGVVMATLLTINFTLLPAAYLVGGRDYGTAANYGWEELAGVVAAEQAAHPDAFLAASRYTYAAQLGFQLHEPRVLPLNPLTDQYDFWYPEAGFAGRPALVIADRAFPIDFPARQFDRCTLLREVPVDRLGRRIWDFELHLCEGFHPATPEGG